MSNKGLKSFLACNQTGKLSFKRLMGFLSFCLVCVVVIAGIWRGEMNELAIIELLGLTMFSMGATSYETKSSMKYSQKEEENKED